MATKSASSGQRTKKPAKKAARAAKPTSEKLTLSKQTLVELESLVKEAAAVRQSRKVCIA
jgi:hypothetical protein